MNKSQMSLKNLLWKSKKHKIEIFMVRFKMEESLNSLEKLDTRNF